jgi:hypothetical protein
MAYNYIEKINDENVKDLIIVKDEFDMFGKGFYGPYEDVEGNKNVPAIRYNDNPKMGKVLMFVMEDEWEDFKERANKRIKEVLMRIAEENGLIEAPTEVPTEEPTETPTEVPTDEPTEEPTDEPETGEGTGDNDSNE